MLHLGNIANNAFNNARIQRLYGIDAFVIAYENFHIMSSPEWEEARFQGDYGNPFFPDWTKVDLAGYVRPNWFAAGPLQLCCAVIEFQLNGQSQTTEGLVAKLTARREAVCLRGYRGLAMRLGTRVQRKLFSELRSLRDGLSGNALGRLARKSPGEARLREFWNAPTLPMTRRSGPVISRGMHRVSVCCRACSSNSMSFKAIRPMVRGRCWPISRMLLMSMER